MQIPAGFGAAIDKFAGSVGHKSNRRNLLPVGFQVALIVMPNDSKSIK
jgi:hypothetical protein